MINLQPSIIQVLKEIGLNVSNHSCVQEIYEWFETKGLFVSILPELYQDGPCYCWQILWYDNDGIIKLTDGTFIYGDNGEYKSIRDTYEPIILKLIEIYKK